MRNKDGSTGPVQRIVATGQPPYRVANTQITIRLANAAVREAVLLDAAGYAQRDMAVRHEGGRLVVDLPADTMYMVLR